MQRNLVFRMSDAELTTLDVMVKGSMPDVRAHDTLLSAMMARDGRNDGVLQRATLPIRLGAREEAFSCGPGCCASPMRSK
jgi:hypothetical protein